MYADNLTLIGDNWKEDGKYATWKKALESKGLKVHVKNLKKIRANSHRKVANDAYDPCQICGKKVTRNSTQCQK